MRRIFLIICILCNCYNKTNSQIQLGLKDTKYIYINYTLNDFYDFKIEQSLYNSEFEYQYARGYLGIHNDLNRFFFKLDCYFGSAYNRTYQNFGIIVFADYKLKKWLKLNFAFNPHYDTYFRLYLCTKTGFECCISKDINFIAYYSSIPEYRQPEHRFKTGINFHLDNRLWVEPIFSIPITKSIKNYRILVGFGYTFY